MGKPLAEFIGTFTLVLFGCGAAVLAGDQIGNLGISLAFGLALIGMAYGIGPVSGCHINPAVTLGVVAAGRMEMGEAVLYMVAQVAGAVVGALVLLLIASGGPEYSVATNGLGQNGWGPGAFNEYILVAAFLFELVATFLFVVVILGATGYGAPAAMRALRSVLRSWSSTSSASMSRRFGQSGALHRTGAFRRRIGARAALALHRCAHPRGRSRGACLPHRLARRQGVNAVTPTSPHLSFRCAENPPACHIAVA